MNIRITAAMAQKIGRDRMEKFGIYYTSLYDRGSKGYIDIDIAKYSEAHLAELLEMLASCADVRGAKKATEDVQRWLRFCAGDKGEKVRSLSEFASMLKRSIARRPGQRLWFKHPAHDAWVPAFVERVEYYPETIRDRERVAEITCSTLHWIECGKYQRRSVSWEAGDVVGATVERALRDEGYFLETPELYRDYAADMERFVALHDKVGLQVRTTGTGTDNLDGNKRSRSHEHRTLRLPMETGGEPGYAVVDVFEESPSNETNRAPSEWFWTDQMDREEREAEYERHRNERSLPYCKGLVPLHPVLACFDIRRQTRVRLHVAQVAEHVYDTRLGDKLVLPPHHRELVTMLLNHTGVFRDVVRGKGGGAIILSAGPPGTGKTLTAEVFSETSQRPLYSVQCSQLGTNPEELEWALKLAFTRARRWNAILLLDEADVYVAQRGTDLTQNAIVGVFLRVLEYYDGVLFLTTNRADAVDDAVASRCIARLNYAAPPTEDQRTLWRILADAIGVRVDAAAIDDIVAAYPRLSGRDIKNLLKLASLMLGARGGGAALDLATVRYVKQFKPTADIGDGDAP